VHGVIAEQAGGAWSFGGSVLTFAFPMILFVLVVATLYVLYTKPDVFPGHRAPGSEHPVSYTRLPGQPPDPGSENAATGAGERTAAPVQPEPAPDGSGRAGTTEPKASE